MTMVFLTWRFWRLEEKLFLNYIGSNVAILITKIRKKGNNLIKLGVSSYERNLMILTDIQILFENI